MGRRGGTTKRDDEEKEEGGRKGRTRKRRRRRRRRRRWEGPPLAGVRRVMKYELHGNRNIVSDINAKGYYFVDESAIL